MSRSCSQYRPWHSTNYAYWLNIIHLTFVFLLQSSLQIQQIVLQSLHVVLTVKTLRWLHTVFVRRCSLDCRALFRFFKVTGRECLELVQVCQLAAGLLQRPDSVRQGLQTKCVDTLLLFPSNFAIHQVSTHISQLRCQTLRCLLQLL